MNQWQIVTDAIPEGRLSHGADDSMIINWNDLVGGARQIPKTGAWIVVVHDLRDADMDVAPELHATVADKSDIPGELISLSKRLISMRTQEQAPE